MASITSVISLFILLLVTYCYSIPIKPENGILTPTDEFTTGKTIVDHENKINMQLMTDDELKGVPNIHKQRIFDEHTPVEFTTVDPLKIHSQRVFKEHDSDELTTVHPVGFDSKRKFDEHDSDEHTTVDSLKIHSQRILKEHDSDEFTTVHPVESHSKRKFDEHDSDEFTTVRPVGSDSKRKFNEHDSDEVTTPDQSDLVAHPSRTFEETTSPMISTFDKNDKHGVDGELLATMESTTEFNKRAMKINDDHSEELSTVLPRAFMENEHEFEMTTVPGSSFSSSADSFDKMSVLLNNGQPIVQTKRLTDPVPIIPGQNQQVIEKKKSNN